MWIECKFCKEIVPVNKWKEHQKKHGLPSEPEKYRMLVARWEETGKPIIKGNVVEFFRLQDEAKP